MCSADGRLHFPMDARLRIKAIGPGPAMVLNGGRPTVTLSPLGLGREAQPFSRFDREVFSGLGMAQQDEVVFLVHLVQGIPNIHLGCWLSQSPETADVQCPGRWGEETFLIPGRGQACAEYVQVDLHIGLTNRVRC